MVVATGFFDGVHLGHRLVISRLVSIAEERGEESCIVTFWPHPRNVLQQEARNLRLLSTMDEKRRMLKEQGVDKIEVLEFTREFGNMTAESYLRDCIVGSLGADAVLVGYDNRIGSDKLPHDAICKVAGKLGIQVYSVGKLDIAGTDTISSTAIRILLSDGKVVEASRMLGYRYSLHGVVVAGNRIGRTIGFPTANMQLYEPLKLVPANGVYYVKVYTLGREWSGMCNIGNRPTIGSGNSRTIETNIFGFDEDIYGLDIRVEFISRIREEVKFDTVDSLRLQLEKDRSECILMTQ